MARELRSHGSNHSAGFAGVGLPLALGSVSPFSGAGTLSSAAVPAPPQPLLALHACFASVGVTAGDSAGGALARLHA